MERGEPSLRRIRPRSAALQLGKIFQRARSKGAKSTAAPRRFARCPLDAELQAQPRRPPPCSSPNPPQLPEAGTFSDPPFGEGAPAPAPALRGDPEGRSRGGGAPQAGLGDVPRASAPGTDRAAHSHKHEVRAPSPCPAALQAPHPSCHHSLPSSRLRLLPQELLFFPYLGLLYQEPFSPFIIGFPSLQPLGTAASVSASQA